MKNRRMIRRAPGPEPGSHVRLPQAVFPALVLGLLFGAHRAGANEDQELLFRLAVPSEAVFEQVKVEIERPDDPRELILVDDGTVAGDLPHDGIHTGRDDGPYTRLLPVRLWVTTTDGESAVAYEGLVQTVDSRQDAVSWRLVREQSGWVAMPTAAAYPGRTAASAGALPTALALLWGVFVFGIVIWIARGRRSGGDDPA